MYIKNTVCLCMCVLVTQLCLTQTPWTVALQAPLSMEFSRHEYWSGFPSPGDLPCPGVEPASPAMQTGSLPLSQQGSPLRYCAAAAAASLQSCPTLCDPSSLETDKMSTSRLTVKNENPNYYTVACSMIQYVF